MCEMDISFYVPDQWGQKYFDMYLGDNDHTVYVKDMSDEFMKLVSHIILTHEWEREERIHGWDEPLYDSNFYTVEKGTLEDKEALHYMVLGCDYCHHCNQLTKSEAEHVKHLYEYHEEEYEKYKQEYLDNGLDEEWQEVAVE